MSYDLMVFEPTAAPRGRRQFLKWYDKQTQWGEGHDYNNPGVSSPALQAWFQEMIKIFPPMNGPYASSNDDDPKVTDYSLGKAVVYVCFAWSCAEQAHETVKRLAARHMVGFFDASSNEGEIIFPDSPDSSDSQRANALPARPWWKFW